MRRPVMLAVLAAVAVVGCGKKRDAVPDTAPPPPVSAAPQPAPQQSAPPQKESPSYVSSFGDRPVNPNQTGNLSVGGGAGGIQAPRMAAARIANEAQMKDLHLSMFQTWTIDNRVQTIDEIKQEARRNSQLWPLIEGEVIILTGTKQGDAVWAYSQFPQRAGDHYVVTSSGVVQMAPEDLRKRLEQEKAPIKMSGK